MISTERRNELDKLVKPVIKWLNDNVHPHHKVIITPSSSELLETQCYTPNDEFIKD